MDLRQSEAKVKQELFRTFTLETFKHQTQVHEIRKSFEKNQRLMSKMTQIMVRQELDTYHPFLMPSQSSNDWQAQPMNNNDIWSKVDQQIRNKEREEMGNALKPQNQQKYSMKE